MIIDDILTYLNAETKRKIIAFGALAFFPISAVFYDTPSESNESIVNHSSNKEVIALYTPKLETSSMPNPVTKSDSNLESQARKLYAKKKLTYEEFITFQRVLPYWETLKNIESITLLKGLKYIIGAESDFIPGRTSNKDARNIGQILPDTIDSIISQMEYDKRILSETLDIALVEKIILTNYTTDIDRISLDSLGFKEEKFFEIKSARKDKKNEFQKEKIRSVIIPRYLKTKELFPDYTINKEEALSNPHYNLRVAGAHHLSNYLELSSLQLIKKSVKNKQNKLTTVFGWVYRPRTFFDGQEQLKAFTENHIRAAYNCGSGNIKKLYEKDAKSGHYDISDNLFNETRGHAKRIDNYRKHFEVFYARRLLN